MPSSKATRSHPYERFIPREEVVEVSAWEFEPMDGSARPGTRSGLHHDHTDETPEPPDAAQLEALREQAYNEGFRQGQLAGAQETHQQLEAPLKQQAREHAARMAAMLEAGQQQMAALEQQLADQLLELACDLARQVVRRELDQPLEPLRAAVHEALAMAVEDGQPAALRLNPADLSLLQDHMGEALAAQKVKLVPDAALTPGGCVVESAIGAVDASVEKRWERSVANLGLQVPWSTPATEAARKRRATDLAQADATAEPNDG
jgi:flagellar assembly protein FliH